MRDLDGKNKVKSKKEGKDSTWLNNIWLVGSIGWKVIL